jgi:hypothetical protein
MKNTRKNNKTKLDIRLTLKGRKYCSCLMKVREKGINPYGICYKSVLRGQNPPPGQGIACTVNYKFADYTNKQLQEYAKEKRIITRYVRGSKRGKKLNRYDLIQKLTRFQKKKLASYKIKK